MGRWFSWAPRYETQTFGVLVSNVTFRISLSLWLLQEFVSLTFWPLSFADISGHWCYWCWSRPPHYRLFFFYRPFWVRIMRMQKKKKKRKKKKNNEFSSWMDMNNFRCNCKHTDVCVCVFLVYALSLSLSPSLSLLFLLPLLLSFLSSSSSIFPFLILSFPHSFSYYISSFSLIFFSLSLFLDFTPFSHFTRISPFASLC